MWLAEKLDWKGLNDITTYLVNYIFTPLTVKCMVKSVVIYGAETCSLYKDDRRRINATQMDALRRSAGRDL
jgi:hypothetical protein